MNILETFERLSLEGLRDYIVRKQEEHLYLDFKLLNDASFGLLPVSKTPSEVYE